MEWMEPWPAVEMDVWFRAWIEGFLSFLLVAALVVALCLLVLLAIADARGPTRVLSRFWCPQARRDVEVEFYRRGLLIRRNAVTSCSAFEPGTATTCRRQCLNASLRHRWEPARPGGIAGFSG